MIIGLLLELVLALFNILTSGLNIVSFPTPVLDLLYDVVSYLTFGLSFLNNYIDVPYFMSLFGIVVGMDVAFGIYDFVMWVLKKIPMLGVE